MIAASLKPPAANQASDAPMLTLADIGPKWIAIGLQIQGRYESHWHIDLSTADMRAFYAAMARGEFVTAQRRGAAGMELLARRVKP